MLNFEYSFQGVPHGGHKQGYRRPSAREHRAFRNDARHGRDFRGTYGLNHFDCVAPGGSERVGFSVMTLDQQILPRTRTRVPISIEGRWIDPHGFWQPEWGWRLMDETLWMRRVGGVEYVLSGSKDRRRTSVVDHGRRQQAEA